MLKNFHLVYKTTITPFFPICLIGKRFCGRFEQIAKLNLKVRKVIVLISNGAVNWFFDKNLAKNARQIFSKIFSSPKYLQKIKRKERETSRKLLKEIKTPLNKLFFGRILNKKGELKLKRIFHLYAQYGQIIDHPGFTFQLYLTDQIKKEIFQKVRKTEKEKKK